jgi:hypothetical protein
LVAWRAGRAAVGAPAIGLGRAAIGVGAAAVGASAIGLGRAAIGVGVDAIGVGVAPIGVGVTHCGGATAAGETGGPALPDWAWAWDGTIPAGTIITTHFAPMVTATLVMPMVTVILMATDTR